MKIAIISDTHIGDATSCLIKYPLRGPVALPTLNKLVQRIGRVDCLVFLGDILDFSIRNRVDVMKGARIFFRAFRDCAGTFVYVPGNHDVEVWELVLDGIAKDNGFVDNMHSEYIHIPNGGGIVNTFLDDIVLGMNFHVAYPNAYFHTDKEFVMLTHGHYWEPYWALGAELGSQWVVGPHSIEEIVSMNHPLSQLACSGLGSAGLLTEYIRLLQRAIKDHDRTRIKRTINVFREFIINRSNANILTRGALRIGEWYLLRKLMGYKGARDNAQWFEDPKTQQRIINYLNASIHEFNEVPSRIIFGHTHTPMKRMYNGTIYMNTGGWLDGGRGAIITHEDSHGWKSEEL